MKPLLRKWLTLPEAHDEYIRELRLEKAMRELRAVSEQLDALGIKHLFQVEGFGKNN
jgi:hypothetical protein